MTLSNMTVVELRRLAQKMKVAIHRRSRRKADIIKVLEAAEDERDPARRYPDEVIIGALEGADGNISNAAEALGSSRSTIYERINRVPAVQIAYFEALEKAKDKVRHAMMEIIGDPTHKDHGRILIFWARTKMREEFGEVIGLDLNQFRHQIALLEQAINDTLDDDTKKKLAETLRSTGFGILPE